MALVLDKLVLMSSLHETQPTIQRLLSGNEFSGKQIMFDTINVNKDNIQNIIVHTYLVPTVPYALLSILSLI